MNIFITTLFLGICSAVDISITGVDYPHIQYTGIIHIADTTARDQSRAKIGIINAIHESGKKNEDVVTLMLYDPRTKYMPIDIFFHFPSVETFHVIWPYQKMEAPINGHFMSARVLKKVFITNQNFRKMGSNVFEGCIELRWLFLEHNQIESVDEATFRGLRTLRKLSLQSNLIRTIQNGTFATLLDLEFLNLNNNLLTALSPDLFAINKLLKTILLGSNRLLFVEHLVLAAEDHDLILMTANLCNRGSYHNAFDANAAIGKRCTIQITNPSDILDEYRQHLGNIKMCDTSDKDRILQLKDDIKITEQELKKLEEENLKLKFILEATNAVEVCYKY